MDTNKLTKERPNPVKERQPSVLKYIHSQHSGIRQVNLSRHAIGYVLRGTKYIYSGDVRREISRGDIFFLDPGFHYTEEVPEPDKPFEQIAFYYTSDTLSRVLSFLNMSFGLDIDGMGRCPECVEEEFVTCHAWSAMRRFFAVSDHSLREGILPSDETACTIKMTELFYMILSQGSCCLKKKLLSSVDSSHGDFEQIMHDHILSDISIGELSRKTNRSVTAFKTEFRRHYGSPPHQWFVRQRLQHSRLLLVSTDKSVSQIGYECFFTNTSHFIKLFRKEYGQTPAGYRNSKRLSGGGA